MDSLLDLIEQKRTELLRKKKERKRHKKYHIFVNAELHKSFQDTFSRARYLQTKKFAKVKEGNFIELIEGDLP